MEFEMIGAIYCVETFAVGREIRELARLRKLYGNAFWRKRKGIVQIRFSDGTSHLAEVHWYEASGIGRKEMKIKRILENQ